MASQLKLMVGMWMVCFLDEIKSTALAATTEPKQTERRRAG